MVDRLKEFNDRYREIKIKEKELIKKMRFLLEEFEEFEKSVEDLYQLSQDKMYYIDKRGTLKCIGGNKTSNKIEVLDSLRSNYSIKIRDIIYKY